MNPEKQIEEFIPSTEYYELPYDSYFIKHEEVPPPVRPCKMKLQLRDTFFSQNNSIFNVVVHCQTIPGNPGVDTIYLQLLSKYFLLNHQVSFDPAARIRLLLAEAEDSGWVISTHEKTTTDVNGEEQTSLIFGAQAHKIKNCPHDRVELFSFPVELVKDKYIKLVAKVKCCEGGENNKVTIRIESNPRFYLIS